ncbi:hypothetical protein [Mycobacterium avium]|uniref:hypothetical protein n=1 Tax=Mycobacterium avium TaxID=1764 RepID=UPI000A023E4F|nr:hypothetical protein [Mycobacterium avium]MBZ4612394.1 hypothetical protein [Mycobacterium avium subsp. hominissuis]
MVHFDSNRDHPQQAHEVEQDPAMIAAERRQAAEEALEDVTRLVIVKDGVYKEFWADSWRVSLQDRGRTVKFFSVGNGNGAIAERARELGEMVGLSAGAAHEVAQKVAEAEGQLDRFDPAGE